jgi:transmembrane 9 superfamily protein 2/4
VPLKVNALTSIHTQVPVDYYRLPFCRPEGGPEMASENLGEFLTGNKIQSSPFNIHMGHDSYCTILCQVTNIDKTVARKLKSHIKYGYNNNWIIDNLPSASLGLSDTGRKMVHFAGGFPIGYTMPKPGHEIDLHTKKMEKKKFTVSRTFWEMEDAFIYNHFNIVLDFHRPAGSAGIKINESGQPQQGYRVVGFAVEPMSIRHRFAGNFEWDGMSNHGFTSPLESCPAGVPHMAENLIQQAQVVEEGQSILYTYDVIFVESPIQWASRWDLYLSEDHMVPAQVHWYSITNSILVVLFLSVILISILVRNLRRDIGRYNAAMTMTDEEKEEELDESGWKLIHADVFRPPHASPMLFAVSVGSGVQITITCMASIVFSALGFLNPARRGSLMLGILIFYILCGSFAGYVSSRLYKCFRGRSWQICTILTAILFPGVCFVLFLFFNVVLFFFHSSGSVPFLDVMILGAMWCCVSIPMVFSGAYFGYKSEVINFPTVTSTIARAIPPPSHWLMDPKWPMLLAGMVPFAAAYVELFFIMTSLWMDQFYYVFGFTLVVFLILLITCSEVTVLLCYYQLCGENHRWWWFSFVTAGSTGFYLFLYSVIWYQQLDPSKMFVTHMLYFGYMFLISTAVFLVTGSTGFLSCLWFTRKIFGTIKVD